MAKIVLACRNCKTLTTEKECPRCKSKDLTKNWKGFIYVIDAEKSEIAKVMNLNSRGRYTIFVA
ncbi:MAG: transcription elongation factor subunit Spt4 [Candidatus Aenigmatarchaeota archaeon]